MQFSLVPVNILPFSNSNIQKIFPLSFIIFSSLLLLIFHILTLLSYEPLANSPDDNSTNDTIFSVCPVNVFTHLNSLNSFFSLLLNIPFI